MHWQIRVALGRNNEVLERSRDRRASETRLYQQARARETTLLFANIQDQLLCATIRCNAAELILKHSDSCQPNRVFIGWSGSRVRKQDVIGAKTLKAKATAA